MYAELGLVAQPTVQHLERQEYQEFKIILVYRGWVY